MRILGIETSCDETSASVVCSEVGVLSNIVYSQIALHKPYGGVVPEVASRSHLKNLPLVINESIIESGLSWSDIDGIAFTYGPGLASSLLVGIAGAKGLSLALGCPLYAINHIEGHIYSIFLGEGAPLPEEVCPYICLVVSGGHTLLVRVNAIGSYTILGQTCDDAAGEAFDKGAKLFGLDYPGGPIVDKLSKGRNVTAVHFPRGKIKADRVGLGNLNHNLCFSFSGLKTALRYYLRDNPISKDDPIFNDIVASYQEAIVDSLVKKTELAMTTERYVAIVGGVSLNSRLRNVFKEMADRKGVDLLLAKPCYCADNAAMIAGLATLGKGISGDEALMIDAKPSLPLD